jgi:hypothetical protein
VQTVLGSQLVNNWVGRQVQILLLPLLLRLWAVRSSPAINTNLLLCVCM